MPHAAAIIPQHVPPGGGTLRFPSAVSFSYNINMAKEPAQPGAPPSASVEREVLHKHYQSGTISTIGRIIERRRQERGSNFLDLLRKARLYYGRAPYDIGAIFLGRITARLARSPRFPLRAV